MLDLAGRLCSSDQEVGGSDPECDLGEVTFTPTLCVSCHLGVIGFLRAEMVNGFDQLYIPQGAVIKLFTPEGAEIVEQGY